MSQTETASLAQEESPSADRRTRWHQLLATLLELLLTPFGISVQSEVQVIGEPPKVDLLLLRREGASWTDLQLRWLPDGCPNSSIFLNEALNENRSFSSLFSRSKTSVLTVTAL